MPGPDKREYEKIYQDLTAIKELIDEYALKQISILVDEDMTMEKFYKNLHSDLKKLINDGNVVNCECKGLINRLIEVNEGQIAKGESVLVMKGFDLLESEKQGLQFSKILEDIGLISEKQNPKNYEKFSINIELNNWKSFSVGQENCSIINHNIIETFQGLAYQSNDINNYPILDASSKSASKTLT